MFKLYLLLFIVIISTFSYSSTKCCHTNLVRFTLKDKTLDCDHFGGKIASSRIEELIYPNIDNYLNKIKKRKCEIKVCRDGQPVFQGIYCGKGICDPFGCNCKGGCIKGDALTNFRAQHVDNVYNVYYPR